MNCEVSPETDRDTDNQCLSSPCLNNAVCIDGEFNYECRCLPGYRGHDCEITPPPEDTINQCASNPCLNGGLCFDGEFDYECQCVPDYTGTNCEIAPPPPTLPGTTVFILVA